MLLRVFRRSNEELFDVVVCAAETEEGVGGQQGVIRRLWELADWD